MDIPYLIQLLNNKMAVLTNGKVLAFNSGDMETINKMDKEIIDTQDTLNKLVMLQTITNAANAANTTPAELISSGLEASQNRPIIIDNATACLEQYNISTYATDPLHERKIADILEVMGAMDTSGIIDTYINNEAIGSPLNGHMILTSAGKYSVDTRLLMALMEQDSNFGTAGLAVNTKNPGNVGNTDSGATVTYDSWEEGVDAVAIWLNDHRIVKVPVEPVVVPDPAPVEAVIPPEEPAVVAPQPENQNQATTTPPVVPPVVPIETPVQATTTPITSTTTPPIIDTSTTTPNFIDPVSTTTPPITSTTTDPIINLEIPSTSTTTPTTSPEIGTTTESVMPTEATSTPEITSTSTQARRIKVKRNRV